MASAWRRVHHVRPAVVRSALQQARRVQWSSSTCAGPTHGFVAWQLADGAERVRFNGAKCEGVRAKPSFDLRAWGPGAPFSSDQSSIGAYFGFVLERSEEPARLTVQLACAAAPLEFVVHPGMYFVAPSPVSVAGGEGVLVSAGSHSPLFTLGGPVEALGRLPYIDGCTDSLLISPPIRGDPCFNHLHFPPSIKQTLHTHPTGRAGIVARGSGVCVSYDPPSAGEGAAAGAGGGERRVALQPGMAFVIPSDVLHAFETTDGETLDVIAFHPDSDTGPAPTDHPMVNRTWVDGISASLLPAIQTSPGPADVREVPTASACAGADAAS